MGIKDLFGKGKKAEFREKAKKEVVGRGKLAPGKAAELAQLSRAHEIDNPAGHDGVAVKWNAPYGINSARAHGLPDAGAKGLGEGFLFITNKRLLFKGQGKSAAVEYSPQANFLLYGEGIRLERTIGNTLLKFKSRSDDTAEIVGELLSALMR